LEAQREASAAQRLNDRVCEAIHIQASEFVLLSMAMPSVRHRLSPFAAPKIRRHSCAIQGRFHSFEAGVILSEDASVTDRS
jgi:hypothetical protein